MRSIPTRGTWIAVLPFVVVLAGPACGGDGTAAVDPGPSDVPADVPAVDVVGDALPADVPAPTRVSPVTCLPDPDCRHVLVACHRGYHQMHPENSIAGIRGVAEVGADVAEIDLRMTRDRFLVLMHDTEVDRTTDGTGKVEDKTWAELQALNLKGAGGDGPDDRKVPLFLDALKLAKEKDIVLYVDLMTDQLDDVVQMIATGEGGPYYAYALVRDGLDTTSAMVVKDPKMLVMPYVKTLDDFTAVLAAIPTVKIVEMWIGAADPVLIAAIHAAGVKAQQDVMGSGDVMAGFGDYTGWREFIDAGLDMPQTDWPTFLVPAVDQYNTTGVFPESGPPVE